MKQILFISLILFSLSIISVAQDGNSFPPASILKPTLKVRCQRDLNYWKMPNLKNFWSWMPQLQFAASGPIDDSSFFTYDFYTPDGKLWFTQDSEPFAIPEGSYKSFETIAVPSWTDKRSSILTGVFSFKITLKNTLQVTSKVVYQGKYNVKKEFAGTSHPDFKNQNIFYVDQDWTLPMAYISANPQPDQEAPSLRVSMWFRGETNGKLQGFLFYNGKQVATTDIGAMVQNQYVIVDGDTDGKFRYEQVSLSFYNVRIFDNQQGYKGRHVLAKNPGNYEIKILMDSELVRNVTFTVGQDGKIVDNGIAKNNGLGGFGVFVPAKVNPIKEGAVDLMSYKTNAFYGNAITGF